MAGTADPEELAMAECCLTAEQRVSSIAPSPEIWALEVLAGEAVRGAEVPCDGEGPEALGAPEVTVLVVLTEHAILQTAHWLRTLAFRGLVDKAEKGDQA
jgi:hypothetical protein